MKPVRLVTALLSLLVACEPAATPGTSSTGSSGNVVNGSTERDLSFPGGGRILFLRSRGPGYTWGRVGLVGSDGTLRYFPRDRFAFPYWDPAASDRILMLPWGTPPVTRSFEVVGDQLRPAGAWRTAEVATFPSLDGTTLAYTPVDRSGRPRTEILRLIDRSTGTETTIRSGGSVPIAWTPDGELLAYPSEGGSIVRWNPSTGMTAPFRPRAAPWEIVWSPGGRRWAGAIGGDPGDAHGVVLIGTRRGKVVARLTVGQRSVQMPTWSPDGTRIAFIVRGAGRRGHRTASLHVYDVRLGVDRVVASPISDARWAAWSPDGRWLLVEDWTRDRWLFVSVAGDDRIPYPWLGAIPRWCCPSSPPSTTAIPVS